MPLPEPPPVILLDLDDTILTFTAGPRDFWAESFRAHADELPGVCPDAFRAAVRHVSDAFWGKPGRAAEARQDLFAARRRITADTFKRLGQASSSITDRIADHYTSTKETSCAPFPGALEGLRLFQEQGKRLALITNGSSTFQRAKIERYGLAGFFDAIFIEGEFGVGKPHASVFQAALDALDADAEQAWMIGDNLHADIAGAQALGIAGVWHDYSRADLDESPPAVPAHVIHGWSDLLGACS